MSVRAYCPSMTFPDWLDRDYRRHEEPVTVALDRLRFELRGQGIATTFRALFYLHKGVRIGPDLARSLAVFSGNKIDPGALVLLPSYAEWRKTHPAHPRSVATGTEG